MKRFLSFVSGVLMGAMVGATLAILLAPASGEEMRAQLQQRANSLRDEVQKAAAERRAELEEQLADLRAPHQ